MVILVVTYTLRPDVDSAELGRLARRMHELAQGPEFGFLGTRSYSAADGSRLLIYEFETLEGLERFRTDPDHLAVQRRGGEFFEALCNEVCVVARRDPWVFTPDASDSP
jgi:hypothetical protein